LDNQNILISVVMSVYNGEDYLEEAIESILNQTYKNFEFIIIDDGSTDKSLGIIHRYKELDDRIILISRENRGLIASLNEGIKKAKGKYIIRMDADDISMPNRFQEQFDFMELNQDVVLCGSFAEKFGIDKGIFLVPSSDKEIRETFVVHSPFIHPSVIIRHSTVKENKIIYNDKYLHAEDYKFWLELLKIGKVHNIKKVLLRYRTSQDQISNKYSKEQAYTSQKIRREFIKDYLGQDIIENSINIETIKKLKSIKNKNKDNTINSIIYAIYLSLDAYSVKSFLYFIFSFNYLKYPYNLKEFNRVIYKHINPNRFYKWL